MKRSWGGDGVGNVFISADDLARLDFSNAYYTWDCGRGGAETAFRLAWGI